MGLPRCEADLTGLLAARWIRESTSGQLALNGPKEQHDEQDDAIERLRLLDTGLLWQAGHSGWRESAIASSEKWADMLARAGHDYQILVVGYVSRFCRNVKLGTAIREELHDAGASIYFCDERILLSNEDDWKRWIDLLVSAEHYSRDLSKRVQRGYRSKWRHHGDPGGWAPLGFRRKSEPPRRVAIDPETIGTAIGLFERYATGRVSMYDLSRETDIHEDAVREILRHPIYNGWVRRTGEPDRPAPWRDSPPVSDELWERVAQVREVKTRGGGPHRSDGRIRSAACCIACAVGTSARTGQAAPVIGSVTTPTPVATGRDRHAMSPGHGSSPFRHSSARSTSLGTPSRASWPPYRSPRPTTSWAASAGSDTAASWRLTTPPVALTSRDSSRPLRRSAQSPMPPHLCDSQRGRCEPLPR